MSVFTSKYIFSSINHKILSVSSSKDKWLMNEIMVHSYNMFVLVITNYYTCLYVVTICPLRLLFPTLKHTVTVEINRQP